MYVVDNEFRLILITKIIQVLFCSSLLAPKHISNKTPTAREFCSSTHIYATPPAFIGTVPPHRLAAAAAGSSQALFYRPDLSAGRRAGLLVLGVHLRKLVVKRAQDVEQHPPESLRLGGEGEGRSMTSNVITAGLSSPPELCLGGETVGNGVQIFDNNNNRII